MLWSFDSQRVSTLFGTLLILLVLFADTFMPQFQWFLHESFSHLVSDRFEDTHSTSKIQQKIRHLEVWSRTASTLWRSKKEIYLQHPTGFDNKRPLKANWCPQETWTPVQFTTFYNKINEVHSSAIPQAYNTHRLMDLLTLSALREVLIVCCWCLLRRSSLWLGENASKAWVSRPEDRGEGGCLVWCFFVFFDGFCMFFGGFLGFFPRVIWFCLR